MINTSELGGGSKNWTISEEFGENDFKDKQDNNIEKNITFEELRKYLDNWENNANVKKFSTDKVDDEKIQRLKAGLNVLGSKNENIETHFSYYGRTRKKIIKNELMAEVNIKKRKSFIDKNLHMSI